MLGEKIGEENGRVTSRRMLPGGDYRYLRMEISFETELTIFGLSGSNIGTYEVFERIPGQVYGEGQGIIMTAAGDSAIWNGHGVGQMREDGTMAFAASVAFQADPASKLARLNSVLIAVEHRTGMDGSAHSELWEWKA
jgi:hypothetical protein